MPIEPPSKPPPLPGGREAEEYRRKQDQFHLALGYCIAKWAEVQDEMFRICWAALRTSPEQTAVVFFRTPTLDSRLSLTDELVRLILPKTVPGDRPHPDLERWNSICARFRALLPVRNRLAHHPVKGELIEVYYEPDDAEAEQVGLFADFRSAFSDAELLRGKHGPTDHLLDDDLAVHLEQVNELTSRLKTFGFDVLQGHVSRLPPLSHPYRPG